VRWHNKWSSESLHTDQSLEVTLTAEVRLAQEVLDEVIAEEEVDTRDRPDGTPDLSRRGADEDPEQLAREAALASGYGTEKNTVRR